MSRRCAIPLPAPVSDFPVLVPYLLTESAESNPAVVAASADSTLDVVPNESHLREIFAPVSKAVAVPIDTVPVARDLSSPI